MAVVNPIDITPIVEDHVMGKERFVNTIGN